MAECWLVGGIEVERHTRAQCEQVELYSTPQSTEKATVSQQQYAIQLLLSHDEYTLHTPT